MMHLKPSKTAMLALGAREIPLLMRKIKGARKLHLRFRPLSDDVLLTLPHHVSYAVAEDFARSKADWLSRQIATHGARVAFEHGAEIPISGTSHRIQRHDGRGTPRIENGQLIIHSQPEFLVRRVRDFLVAQARAIIIPHAEHASRELGVTFRTITLRDTGSRWGSCTKDGALSFSWRLVMAPEYVLKYVVYHEMAHRVEMNHSPRFWAVVASLMPEYAAAERWLSRHGHTLYYYG